MLEIYGNIWDLAPDYDAVVITTNGFVKKNGEAVMGRGIALEAKNRYSALPERLGICLKEQGNRVFVFPHFRSRAYKEAYIFGGFFTQEQTIITYPVKPIVDSSGRPGWQAKAELSLIEQSAKELVEVADLLKFDKIILPRPGCGNGGLKWEDVKPVIEPLLDDRFTVVTFHP